MKYLQPVLFLDIDGVLNTTRTFIYVNQNNLPINTLDPVACSLLRYIQQETNCKIVISSTWRILSSLEEISQAIGIGVKDKTPEIPSRHRGSEIDIWMKENYYPPKYAILDDDSDMLESQIEHFVKTEFNDGLLWKHVEKIIRLL